MKGKVLMDNIGGVVFSWWVWPLLAWAMIWKGLGLWRAASNKSVGWFVALMILNTIGFLEILYIFVFSKIGKKKK